MKLKVNKIGSWLVYQSDSTNLDPAQIIDLYGLEPDEILRHHHRSLVIKTAFENEDYVIKTPHNKNRSAWIMLTTLYRDSEVVRDLKAQSLLNSININTVTPVAAMEKRKYGLVVNSSIIYKFKPGQTISAQHYPQMVSIMNTLHENGFLHDDPHYKNFLEDENNVFVIDCKPRNNLLGELGIAFNNITLARRSESKQSIFALVGKSPDNNALYKFADKLLNLQQVQRSIKNKLRKVLGIEHKRSSTVKR